ncbi:MAG: heme o synthase [Gemmataceae bacterium]
MKAAALETPVAPARLADYVALAKPRVAVLVLFTVGAGVLLASSPAVPLGTLLHAVLGTALVATGASALNQWLERDTDALMRRTRSRPLPAGRMSPTEVLTFGFLCGAGGTAYLLLALPSPCAGLLAAFTFFAYVCVYTPLKRFTTLNTLVGAVPGAMPPVIGWCAVTGEVTPEAMTLFVIVFLWQVPHFLAIAWIYREEYSRAGLAMLPGADPAGAATARQMVLYGLALVATSLGPVLLGSAGWLYVAGALLLGAYFAGSTFRFGAGPSVLQARRVLRASLVYLPGLLLALLLDRSIHVLMTR